MLSHQGGMAWPVWHIVPMTWSLGVLIAGSLHWSPMAHRSAWRKARLQTQADVSVGAPIRYGRRSSSRGGTYTMVFAPGTPLGKAKVRRCKRTCLGIDEIVSEAEALWLAESPDGSARKRSERLGAGWGCVTLLPNPHSVVPLTLLTHGQSGSRAISPPTTDDSRSWVRQP
jgi:hypothetical protein